MTSKTKSQIAPPTGVRDKFKNVNKNIYKYVGFCICFLEKLERVSRNLGIPQRELLFGRSMIFLAGQKNHVAGIQSRPAQKNHVAGILGRPAQKIMSWESQRNHVIPGRPREEKHVMTIPGRAAQRKTCHDNPGPPGPKKKHVMTIPGRAAQKNMS